jgi:DNA-binding FadR family transcriptional regulator
MNKTLAEKLYTIIEEKIVKLEFKPGSFLTENFLEKDLKCGRTPIREAIQRLSREGLVKVLPRKGLLVTEININDQLNLIQVRREIERLMAKLSAQNSTNVQKNRFKAIRIVGGLSRRFWYYRNKRTLDDLPLMAKLHSNLCDAISKGNIKLAQEKSDKLMDYIEKFTKESIQL